MSLSATTVALILTISSSAYGNPVVIGEVREDAPAAKIAMLRTAAIRPASLDAPVGDNADSDTLGDLVEDNHAHNPYEDLEEKTVNSMLVQLLDTLSTREAEILKYRFGLDGGDIKTLEDVGVEFGVTRERVRQIQNIALGRMRKMIEKMEKLEHH